MLKKSFVDETFDYNMTSHYELSIQLSLDGFSFLVYDVTRNKFIACQLHPLGNEEKQDRGAALKHLLAQSELAKHSYKKVDVINQSNRYTLVPHTHVDEQQLKDYFCFNHTLGEAEELHASSLLQYGAVVVHAVSSNLTNILRQYFPKFQITHQTLPFIKRIELAAKNEVLLGVNAMSGQMDLALLDETKQQLKFIKSTPYKTTDDVLYWLLATIQQQGLKPSTPLLINGGFSTPGVKEAIRRESINAKWLSEQSNDYTMSYQFHQIPLKSIANQLNLVHCE